MKLRALLCVFFAVLLGFCAGAEIHSWPRSNTEPRKFDEFGALGHCDLAARLDNLAIQLEHDPETVAHIVAYGPEGEGPGAGKFNLKVIKDYLVEVRKLPKRRLKMIYAGRNQVLYEPRVELWILPRRASWFEPYKFDTDIEVFKGLFFEKETSDFIEIEFEDEMGPGIGLGYDGAFADILREQKKAIGYIVIYNGEGAVPGSAKRVAATRLDALKLHNVDVRRVRTIFGGVRKKTTFQLWISATGDPPPAKDAGDEPPPIRNALITSQADSTLGVPANERAVFNRMLEVLRAQPSVKAVLIVKLGAPQEPQPSEKTDKPPADLPKMVQKWREELTNTHKIRADRFIVLFSTTDPERAGNSIDLWAVQPGLPFPDPNDDKEEEESSDVVQDPKRRP
ncbi:MAG TPA: hypothetical protein VFY51_01370 [Pyrinomonadaceae bacterium]|nr:hypothetical protein [Pyrinomonadaceae bacterium]